MEERVFLDGKQPPYELAETCDEPSFYDLMQKLWQLRPQVAFDVYLLRCSVSESPIHTSLIPRPPSYQTVLLTNCLVLLPWAISVGDHCPGTDSCIDTRCDPQLLENLQRAEVQHAREMLAANEQRATAEHGRSLVAIRQWFAVPGLGKGSSTRVETAQH